jgi:L-serine deaminase
MRRNERHWKSDAEIDAGLMKIWGVMQACVVRGCKAGGVAEAASRCVAARRPAPAVVQQSGSCIARFRCRCSTG